MGMYTPDISTGQTFFMGVTVGAILTLILLSLISATTKTFTESAWQDRAVKEGKAEYYLDADNVRQWRWKQ